MPNQRGLIFLGLALAMGIAAAWLTERFVSSPAPTEADAPTTSVVVVRTDVPVATSLAKEQLKTIDWPVDHVPPGSMASADQAVGRVVRRPLADGEAVLETALFEMGASGGLRAVISPEHRAVSVKVDNVIGVAGFVTPGARVDVLATLRRVDLNKAIPYSKVILQDIRVLAIDQKLEEVKSGDPETVSVVTLEVNPVQAEHLTYAAHEGRLQLAMRSPGDDEKVPTVSVGVRDVLGGQRRATRGRVGPAVQIINGSRVDTRRF
jgi:pilus assembly protein CpaB